MSAGVVGCHCHVGQGGIPTEGEERYVVLIGLVRFVVVGKRHIRECEVRTNIRNRTVRIVREADGHIVGNGAVRDRQASEAWHR